MHDKSKSALSVRQVHNCLWLDKIQELLTHHQIPLVNSDYQIWALMNGKEDGKVHVFVMKRTAGPSSLRNEGDLGPGTIARKV